MISRGAFQPHQAGALGLCELKPPATGARAQAGSVLLARAVSPAQRGVTWPWGALGVENTGSGNESHSRALECIDGFVSAALGLSPTHMCRTNKVLRLVSRNVTRRAAQAALTGLGAAGHKRLMPGISRRGSNQHLAPSLSCQPAPVLSAHSKGLCVSEPEVPRAGTG